MESKFKLTVTKSGCKSHGVSNCRICKAPLMARLAAKRAAERAKWAAKQAAAEVTL